MSSGLCLLEPMELGIMWLFSLDARVFGLESFNSMVSASEVRLE